MTTHNTPRPDREAQAPYNFVPLPERVVEAQSLPDQDRYHADRQTGYFDIELETLTPLYVRCGLSARERPRQGDKRTAWEIAQAEKNGEKKTSDFRQEMRHTPDFFYTNRKESPVIPGSSLRGMVRGLLEIVSYGKLDRVTDRQLFFRSVDDSSLGLHYRERMVGKVEYGNKVEAGFLSHDAQGYFIRICRVFRVDRSLLDRNLYDGRGPNMTPRWRHQYRPVWVQEPVRGVRVADIDPQARPGYSEGRLVITGNMQGKKYEFVFLLPDADAEIVRVPEEKVERFHDDDQITQWQQKAFPASEPKPNSRERDGRLTKRPTADSDPVFLLREKGELTFFGRAQMFRLPYFHSPKDLVPEELKSGELTDFAEALFGYVDKGNRTDQGTKQGNKARSYAGRVFVSDALYVPDARGPWLDDPIQVPPILSTPKPTSFQHYLAQPTDNKRRLEHYGSPDATLRGHKLYWHQGEIEASRLQEHGQDWLVNGRVKPDSTQHTQIKPVRAGVGFRFRIYFENLTPEELGALAWTLQPQGDAEAYAHKLGMGKSLGMGSVRLNQITLRLTDRRERYAALFDGDDWERGESEASIPEYVSAFEAHLLHEFGLEDEAQSLRQVRRIAHLLRMLEWYDELTEDERWRVQNQSLDDFKQRKVLPSPLYSNEQAGLLDPRAKPPPKPGRDDNAGREPQRPTKPTVTDDNAGQEPQRPTKTTATVVSYRNAKAYVTLDGVDGFTTEVFCQNAPAWQQPPAKGDRYQVAVTYDRAGKVTNVKWLKTLDVG